MGRFYKVFKYQRTESHSATQQRLTCSNSTTETLQKGAKDIEI